MSLELWNTVGTLGTFLVIAATGIAALIQLHHMRGSNQIAVLGDLNEKKGTPEFVASLQFVLTELPQKMEDRTFRYQVVNVAARTEENYKLIANAIIVGNYYEETGILYKSGLVDRELMFNMLSGNIAAMWDVLSDLTATLREGHGRAVWENFEYVTVLSQDWLAKHPSGTYPANTRRIELPNK
jgi:hypothetical protein